MDVDPIVFLAATLIAISVYLGGEIVTVVKKVAHKTKCGIELIVGKHSASCQEIKSDDPTTPRG